MRRHYGVRTQDYKLIHYCEIDEWELFDLKKDPDEMQSVYRNAEYDGVGAQLEERLRQLREACAVPAEDPVPCTR